MPHFAFQEQVRREGIPLRLADSPDIKVQHAPCERMCPTGGSWRVHCHLFTPILLSSAGGVVNSDGSVRQNAHFEDEVLFAQGVRADTSFVILDG